jgi:hypothetical protein
LSQAKKKDLKSVTGYTRGAGEKRNIRASYIVEAPVWKTTYRLLFNNKSTRHFHPPIGCWLLWCCIATPACLTRHYRI